MYSLKSFQQLDIGAVSVQLVILLLMTLVVGIILHTMETYKNFTTPSVIKNILHSAVSLHACLYTGISLVGDIGDQEIVAATS